MVKNQNCFIAYIKTDDVYIDIGEDVETRFDTSNYELDIPLTKGKNKKVIGLLKGELDRKIMTKFVPLRAKAYSYLKDDGSENKYEKGTEKWVMKRKPKFENYKTYLERTKLENKMNYLKNKINIESF